MLSVNSAFLKITNIHKLDKTTPLLQDLNKRFSKLQEIQPKKINTGNKMAFQILQEIQEIKSHCEPCWGTLLMVPFSRKLGRTNCNAGNGTKDTEVTDTGGKQTACFLT